MTKRPTSDTAFTDAVKATQKRLGSRALFERMERRGGWRSSISDDLAQFIATRDSFYLATASADGQPYVQHRGGPPGFLKVLDRQTLAFADVEGNRQYLSLGNLSENDKAFIFLMDYAHRRRVKLWGRAKMVEDDPKLLAQLAEAGSGGEAHRYLVFSVQAWDVNCPQHITPRHTEDDIAEAMARMQSPLQNRIAELEAQVATLQEQLAGAAPPNDRLPRQANSLISGPRRDAGIGWLRKHWGRIWLISI